MEDRTLPFIIFTLFNVLSLVAGYVARRGGWLDERHSRPLHLVTVTIIWPIITVLSIWSMRREAQAAWLLAVIPVLMLIGAGAGALLGNLIGCTPKQTGVIAIAAALGNLGFTAGGYLCYCILGQTMDDRISAFAYALAAVTVMQVAAVPICYPIARHYGEAEPGETLWLLIGRSFWDVRAMPLYAALLGLALNLLHVPRPAFVWETWLFDPLLLYIGAFSAVFGIGMRLRPGDWRRYLKQHAVLAVIKFGVFPASTALLLSVIALSPRPIEGLLAEVLWIESFMPTALMTVMLANVFHLDTRLAAVAWLVNTAVFVLVPLPVLLIVYGQA